MAEFGANANRREFTPSGGDLAVDLGWVSERTRRRRPHRRRSDERDPRCPHQAARTRVDHHHPRASRRHRPRELEPLEQRRDRPLRPVRAQLHARARRRHDRHLQGRQGQRAVPGVTAVLVVPRRRGPAARARAIHQHGAAHELRVGRRERRSTCASGTRRSRTTRSSRASNTAKTPASSAPGHRCSFRGAARSSRSRRLASSPAPTSTSGRSPACWSTGWSRAAHGSSSSTRSPG